MKSKHVKHALGAALYAAFAVTVSFLTWIALQPPAYVPNSYVTEGVQAGDENRRPTPASCQPDQINSLPTSTQRLEKTERCQDEARQHQLTQHDLVQQTRAADAAEANAFLGVKQTRIGAAQAAYTALAFFAAALAVFYAQRAASHTQRQVKIAKQTANRQLRAYVIVEAGNAGYDTSGVLFIGPALKNVGQTPAHKVRYIADTALLTLEQASRYDFEVRATECLSVMTLAGTAPIFMKIDLSPSKFTPEQVRAILSNSDLRMFVFGQVYYDDVFGVEQTTKFCRYAEWHLDPSNGAITSHMLWGFNRHNEAT